MINIIKTDRLALRSRKVFCANDKQRYACKCDNCGTLMSMAEDVGGYGQYTVCSICVRAHNANIPLKRNRKKA